jgi:ElaB/YqjD/DUF883 family membrane-anchored ribosome-binding protein
MFAIFALIILAASVNLLILHFKVMKRRGAVDSCFEALDESLRELNEQIFKATDDETQREKCIESAALDTRSLLRTLRKKIPPETKEQIKTANQAINMYNDYISKSPMRQMAFVLGLGVEKKI